MNRFIHISRDTIHTQSKGCYLCIQCGYTAIMFRNFWRRQSNWQGIRIHLFSPVKSDDGYRRKRVGLRLG